MMIGTKRINSAWSHGLKRKQLIDTYNKLKTEGLVV